MMSIQLLKIYVFAILLFSVLVNADVIARSVCFEDFSRFFRSHQACAFNKTDFDKIFRENTIRCQIECSILSTNPPYHEMNKDIYRINKIRYHFLSDLYEFVLIGSCILYNSLYIYNTAFDIEIGCEGEFIQDRGIGERCLRDNQCNSVTINSTCNETSGVCQCKPGHLYSWESNTCLPVKRETEKAGKSQAGLVMGVGVTGIVLGVAVCGILYFIMTRHRNRCESSNIAMKEETSVQVSCSLYRTPINSEEGRDDIQDSGVYNHLHESAKVCVPRSSDHVPEEAMDNDDYSHLNTRSVYHVDISGEYGMIE